MKLNRNIIFGIFILFGFSQCISSKNTVDMFVKDPSFKIIKAVYTDWIGGVQGVRGTTIEIIVDNQDVIIESLFFRNHVIKAELNNLENNNLQIIGNIINSSTPDLIIHKDPKEEYGNKPPIMDSSFLFELASDELVISYLEKENIKYLKIKLTKGKRRFYQ